MYFMYLYIFFVDGRIEKHRIKRFSDLSQTKSKYYYYEEPNDIWGKGKTFLREEILCFEVSPYELRNWEDELQKKGGLSMGEQYKKYELHEHNGVQYPFKARPYDDADYYYARSKDSGKTWFICFKGKIQKIIAGTWQDAVDILEELNASIRPRMCHN